jgi:hypothetical protein
MLQKHSGRNDTTHLVLFELHRYAGGTNALCSRALINYVGNSFSSITAQLPNTVMLLNIISAGMIGGNSEVFLRGDFPLTGLDKTVRKITFRVIIFRSKFRYRSTNIRTYVEDIFVDRLANSLTPVQSNHFVAKMPL